MDSLTLARMQCAANITFHSLFPTIGIALGWLLLFFRLSWLAGKSPDPSGVSGYTVFAYRVFRGKATELRYA